MPPTRSRALLFAAALILIAGPTPAADPPAPALRLADRAAVDQDDMCVWVHPTDPAKSTVIASDKKADRLFVYDLGGKTLQAVDVKYPGNIDTRPGFRVGGRAVDVVAVNLRADKTLAVYAVDPESRGLTRIDDGSIATGENYGGCLYRSGKSGKVFAVVTSKAGVVAQYELSAGGAGKVRGKPVRTWRVGGVCEAAVADDPAGKLFIAEEKAGVWELGAEPDDPAPGRLVVKVGEHGLKGDVEGLAIFARADGAGYLLVSDQGASLFRVYRRGGRHEYVGSFAVAGATETDGIEVVAAGLGPKFPAGVFVCHSAAATPCPVLVVPWDRVAAELPDPLAGPAAGRRNK